MRFGAPREVLDEITLPDINNCTDKTISKRQAQDLLKKKGIELIEDEEFLNRQPEPSPFDTQTPFGDKDKQPFPPQKKEVPLEMIEKINDLPIVLDLIEENYKARYIGLVEACKLAERTIRVNMQRVYGEDWQERYEVEFQKFIRERIGGKAKHEQVYTVKVEQPC
jgi:hypothetical protein